MKFVESACLLGENTKYNGLNNRNEELIELLKGQEVITVCPEVLGGLSTPRYPSEIKGDRVLNSRGEDVTFYFEAGARKSLDKVLEFDPDYIITMDRSPSCGKAYIYDGSFSKNLIQGDGIFIRMLKGYRYKILGISEAIEKLHHENIF